MRDILCLEGYQYATVGNRWTMGTMEQVDDNGQTSSIVNTEDEKNPLNKKKQLFGREKSIFQN